MPSIPNRLRTLFSRLVTGVGQLLPGKPQERKIPVAEIKPALERYVREYNARVQEYADDLASGKDTVRIWRARMQAEIRLLHWAAAAVGAGGFANLRPEDYGEIERATNAEVAFLNKWAAQLERQATPISAAQVTARARQYGGAGTVTASRTQTRTAGWPELPFEPKDRTKCRRNCKCGWQWRNVDQEALDADVYWKLADAEHCETCLRRAAACKPLKIRGGVIINLPANMNELIAS